jgi:inward rectifier potassium channel
MTTRRRSPTPMRIGREEFGMSKVGASLFDLSDPYHTAVSLSWPGFIGLMILAWLAINLLFATLYVLSPGDIANTRPGSFADVFFFSIETLATVGYGVMAPSTTYGHIVSAAEIVTGTAFTAIVTGVLFVRFSRPKANIVYADDAVVAMRNGKPTLMVRLASGRMSIMTSANARLFVLLAEKTDEGESFRRIHDLHLIQSHLPLFVMPWTLMHTIDETSPLFAKDGSALIADGARLFLTLEARDQALNALVQDMKNYMADHILFGMRYADAVTLDADGHAIADLSRVSMVVPETAAASCCTVS